LLYKNSESADLGIGEISIKNTYKKHQKMVVTKNINKKHLKKTHPVIIIEFLVFVTILQWQWQWQ
jgi:hypothetical protein